MPYIIIFISICEKIRSLNINDNWGFFYISAMRNKIIRIDNRQACLE